MHLLNYVVVRNDGFQGTVAPTHFGRSRLPKKWRRVHQRAPNAISGCDSRCLGPVRRDHHSTIGEAMKIDE
jgi:hypothetical protein